MSSKKKLQNVMNDFDMYKNYTKIIKRRKRKHLFFCFKIVTVPICIIMFVCCLLLFQSNNKFDNTDNNRFDNVDNDKDNINNLETNLDIYSIVDKENSWAYDVSNTETLYEKADIIIKAKVLEIGKGTYKYTPNLSPTTPIYVETLEVLKGNVDSNINIILKRGGVVTVREVIENSPSTSVNKMGLNLLTEEEKNTKYIVYNEDGNYDLEVGKTYVIALRNGNDGNYYISANGYSIFQVSNQKIYTNVLTGNELFLE